MLLNSLKEVYILITPQIYLVPTSPLNHRLQILLLLNSFCQTSNISNWTHPQVARCILSQVFSACVLFPSELHHRALECSARKLALIRDPLSVTFNPLENKLALSSKYIPSLNFVHRLQTATLRLLTSRQPSLRTPPASGPHGPVCPASAARLQRKPEQWFPPQLRLKPPVLSLLTWLTTQTPDHDLLGLLSDAPPCHAPGWLASLPSQEHAAPWGLGARWILRPLSLQHG